jgi:hypothetical protein
MIFNDETHLRAYSCEAISSTDITVILKKMQFSHLARLAIYLKILDQLKLMNVTMSKLTSMYVLLFVVVGVRTVNCKTVR